MRVAGGTHRKGVQRLGVLFNVLDLETLKMDAKTVAYCACFKYKSNVFSFYGLNTLEKFFSFVEKNKLDCTIYVHNLSFDGGIILNYVKEKSYMCSGFFFNGSIYSLTITGSGFRLYFRCSYKLFPLSLKKISELIKIDSIEKEGVETSLKGEFPHEWIDHTKIFYKGPHPTDANQLNWDARMAALNYCKNDVNIVSKFLKRIFQEFYDIEPVLNNLGGLDQKKSIHSLLMNSLSISSLSLNTYRLFFNKNRLSFKNSTEEDLGLRPSYYGGRCEVFGNPTAGEFVHHFDFTGMYAQVMEDPFCFGKIDKISPANDEKTCNHDRLFYKPGFYKVRVYSNPQIQIPLLPRRDPVDMKLTFPNGRWVGVYWWEELNFFLENGGLVEEVYEHWSFEKNEKIFIEFVQFFKSLRNKSELGRQFWKLFINSLSGRMGIRPNNAITKIVSIENYYKIRKNHTILKESINGGIILVTYERKSLHLSKENGSIGEHDHRTEANVFIAAAITAKARVKLAKALLETIKQGGRLLYCDTDSVFAAFKDKRYAQKQDEITWDEENIYNALFAIPKGYALQTKAEGDVVKLKGYRRDSISFDEFKNLWENNEKIRIKELHLSRKNLRFQLDEVEKTIYINNYTKRIFDSAKKSTWALMIT